MAVPKSIQDSTGIWKGDSTLHLLWEKEPAKQTQKSKSTLHVEVDHHAKFATITYTWEYDGKLQEGTLLLAGNKAGNDVSAGWSDSWHQDSGVMALRGAVETTGTVNLKGSYEVPGSKPWGWRISLSLLGKAFVLKMFNIHPDGKQEDWAVEATYHKE